MQNSGDQKREVDSRQATDAYQPEEFMRQGSLSLREATQIEKTYEEVPWFKKWEDEAQLKWKSIKQNQ